MPSIEHPVQIRYQIKYRGKTFDLLLHPFFFRKRKIRLLNSGPLTDPWRNLNFAWDYLDISPLDPEIQRIVRVQTYADGTEIQTPIGPGTLMAEARIFLKKEESHHV